MLEILSITVPIYLVIAAGYVSTRAGMFTAADMLLFGKFVLNLALPALVVTAVSSRPVAEVLHPAYLATYAAGSLLMLAAASAWLRLVSRLGHLQASIDTMGMVCPNSGFVGYPLMLLLMPALAGTVLGMNMIVENFLIIPLLLMMLEAGREGQGSRANLLAAALLRTLRSPIVIGLMIGLALSVSGLAMPLPAARAVDLFANASGAISLFVIGGTLVGIPLSGMRTRVTRIVAGKLLFHPLAMLAAVALLPGNVAPEMEAELVTALVITSALPIMGIYTILAQRNGAGELSAVALLATSALSFVTLSLLLYGLRNLGYPV